MSDKIVNAVDYEAPQFWEPSNAIGKAASVRGVFNGSPIILNFYWAGMSLTFRPEDKRGEDTLRHEVTDFLKTYQPKQGDDQIQHFVHDDESFRRATDPHWVEGHPVN